MLPGVSGMLKTSTYISICQTRAADIGESCESWKSESWTSEAAFEKHPSLQQCRPGKVELFDFVFQVSPLVDHANTAKGGRIFLNLKPASATEESARAATSVPGSTSKSYQVGQLSGKQEQVLL